MLGIIEEATEEVQVMAAKGLAMGVQVRIKCGISNCTFYVKVINMFEIKLVGNVVSAFMLSNNSNISLYTRNVGVVCSLNNPSLRALLEDIGCGYIYVNNVVSVFD